MRKVCILKTTIYKLLRGTLKKKSLWLLATLVTLGLIVIVTIVSMNVAETKRIEAEQQAAREEASRLNNIDRGFAKYVRDHSEFLAYSPPEVANLDATLINAGKDACFSISKGTKPGEVAFETKEGIPLASVDAAILVSRAIEVYCPDSGTHSVAELEKYVHKKIEDAVWAKVNAEEKTYRDNIKKSGKFFDDISEQMEFFGIKGKKWSEDYAVDVCFMVDSGNDVQSQMSKFVERLGGSYDDRIGAVAVAVHYACPEKQKYIDEWQLAQWN